MASAIIHIAVAKKVNKVIERNEKDLFLGEIAPDVAKLINMDRKKTHFIKPNENTDVPNIKYFKSLYIDKIKSDGYNVSLVNARFLKPIDFQMFNEITKKNKPIFVYEESMQIGGLGSYLSSITDKEIITYAIKDEFVNEGTREELLEYLGLDTDTIYNKIKEVITSARVRK